MAYQKVAVPKKRGPKFKEYKCGDCGQTLTAREWRRHPPKCEARKKI